MVVSFRRTINPALVLLYAAIEGVFIGMISKYFETCTRASSPRRCSAPSPPPA